MDKLSRLKTILKKISSCALAYSGGVDSTFLLKASRDVLGDNLLAVTAVSPTYTKEELYLARKMTKRLGVRHEVIRTQELSQENFAANPVNRCYYCKKELFGRLRAIAEAERLNYVIDASTLSDKKDFRPGAQAKKESGVRSPLQEAGFTKNDVRSYSRRLGLTTWNNPAMACLASRIPYGQRITFGILKKVSQGEKLLKDLGLSQVRLRHYGRLCRIEVLPKEFSRLILKKNVIVEKLKKLGYNYVTVDLEGYRAGSMNEVIK